MAAPAARGEEIREPPPQNDQPYALYNMQYVQSCYLHQPTMATLNAWILRCVFSTPDGKEVTTLIPTGECFRWHSIDDDTRTIFQNSNLDGYFGLLPWGADVKRAWQLVSSFNKDTGTCRVQDLQGNDIEFPLTNDLISKALNLKRWSSILPLKIRNLTDAEKLATTSKPESKDSTFEALREPRIRRALEAFMLHLSFNFPHRFTKPKLFIAFHFTKALQDPADAKCDFSPYILKAIELASRQKTKRGNSLSGILALTRVAYAGIGSLEQLPPAGPMNSSIHKARTPVKRRHDYAKKLQLETVQRSSQRENDEGYAPMRRNPRTKRRLDPQQEEAPGGIPQQEEAPGGIVPMPAALDPLVAQAMEQPPAVIFLQAPPVIPQAPVVPNEGSTNNVCELDLGRFFSRIPPFNASLEGVRSGLPPPDIFPQAPPGIPEELVGSTDNLSGSNLLMFLCHPRQSNLVRSFCSPSQSNVSRFLCQSVNFSPPGSLEDVPSTAWHEQLAGPTVAQEEGMPRSEPTVARDVMHENQPTNGVSLEQPRGRFREMHARMRLQRLAPASQQSNSNATCCAREARREWQKITLDKLQASLEAANKSPMNKDEMMVKLTTQLEEARKACCSTDNSSAIEDFKKYMAQVLKETMQAHGKITLAIDTTCRSMEQRIATTVDKVQASLEAANRNSMNKDEMILKLTAQLEDGRKESIKDKSSAIEDFKKYMAEIQALKEKMQAAELEKQESNQQWEFRIDTLQKETNTAKAEAERWKTAALELGELCESSQKRAEEARQEADNATRERMRTLIQSKES